MPPLGAEFKASAIPKTEAETQLEAREKDLFSVASKAILPFKKIKKSRTNESAKALYQTTDQVDDDNSYTRAWLSRSAISADPDDPITLNVDTVVVEKDGSARRVTPDAGVQKVHLYADGIELADGTDFSRLDIETRTQIVDDIAATLDVIGEDQISQNMRNA